MYATETPPRHHQDGSILRLLRPDLKRQLVASRPLGASLPWMLRHLLPFTLRGSTAMHLRDLASHAEISNYDFVFWFSGAELKGDVLLVANAPCGRFIASCWGAKMRELVR